MTGEAIRFNSNQIINNYAMVDRNGERNSSTNENADTYTKGSDGRLNEVDLITNLAKKMMPSQVSPDTVTTYAGNGGSPLDVIGGILWGKPDSNKALLDKAFGEADKKMAASTDGNIQKEANGITKTLFTSIVEYAKNTGKSAEAVADDIKQQALKHPAISVVLLISAGMATGAVLEKYGILNGAAGSLSSLKQQIEKNPLVAAAIGVAVGASAAYLINLALTSPALKPPAADTPQKQQLSKSLDDLEKEVYAAGSGDSQKDAQGVSKKFFDAAGKYAASAGKSVREACEDVKSFMTAHPGVTAAVIFSAGVATGALLEKAGIPEKLAFTAGTAFDAACAGSKKGAREVADTIKENPVLSGVIISALVAGAGYLAYQYLSSQGANRITVF